MTPRRLPLLASLAVGLGAAAGCAGGGDGSSCGHTRATVATVYDGDTITLATGEKVRYLMVNAPEISGGAGGGADCYGIEATTYNRELVEGKEIELAYDVECEDMYGRLLAYVSLPGTGGGSPREINSLIVQRGYACVLRIPPNGADRADEFDALEAQAQADDRGMWSACEVITCD
jgi:micrococcal nuclease